MRRSRLFWILLALAGPLSAATGCYPWCTDPAPPPPVASSTRPARLDVTIGGRPVTVHALPSGTVAVKGCHRENCRADTANYGERFYAILEDCAFAAPMPILSYVIEHPEGRFAIDTGETPAFSDDAAWACDSRSGLLHKAILRIEVPAAETLGARLLAMGTAPTSFQAIVLTHAHADHVGGIAAFAGVPIFTTRAELEAGTNYGVVPCRTMAGRTLRYLDEVAAAKATDPADEAESLLGRSLPLTSDGSLRAFVVAGHTPGSLMLRLSTDQGDVWFIGDIAFSAGELGGKLAGIHADLEAVRKVQAALKTLTAKRKSIVLPSHDASVPERMATF